MELKASILLVLFSLLFQPLFAQKAELTNPSCGITTSILEASKTKAYQKRLLNYKKKVADVVTKELKSKSASTIPCLNGITIIPITFHLFYESGDSIGEGYNFSLADLKLVVDYLNMHFSGVNPRKEVLGDAYVNFDAGNTCIQFTIAKVNRITTESCEYWAKNVTQYQLHKCLPGGSGEGSENDPNDFLNLYVTKLHGGLLGQASNIPGILGKSNATSDGVTISRNIIIPGDNNVTLYDKGGILSHEIGHWLGLPHVDGDIQGSGCQGDDGISDTYPQEKKNVYICSEPIPYSCETPDNVYNFMDYSMDCAKLMFTKEQAIIMNDVLRNERSQLSQSYERMGKTSLLYELEGKEAHSTAIEWQYVDCQGSINLLEFQQEWTMRLESHQGFSGTKNYYWEKKVTSSTDKTAKVIDDRYLSMHNVLSGIGDLQERSVIIYKLKEQSWNSTSETYELAKTKGIIIVVVSPCPTPVNDKIENAIVLNQGTLCREESYSLLHAQSEIPDSTSEGDNSILSNVKDVWFKIETTPKKEMLEFMIKRPNTGESNPMLEAYTMNMDPLNVSKEQEVTEDHFLIDKTEGNASIYLRIYDKEKTVADPFQICRIIKEDLNDDCDKALTVHVQKSCEWLGYSFKGSKPSTDLEVNYNCGANKEYYDVWFEAEIPKYGYFSVKCRNKTGEKNDLLLEVYSGTCENKQLLGCQMIHGIYSAGKIAYLPFVGMKAGEKIYIRVGGKSYGQQGDFEMCVSQSFENVCTITKIEMGEVTDCENITNTYSQDLMVHYQSTGALNKVIVNGQYFTLSENPQKITLINLTSDKVLSVKANLLNTDDPSCWDRSSYTIEASDKESLPCIDETK